MARTNIRWLLALSLALLLLSRPAVRLAAAQEDDDEDMEGIEDYGAEDEEEAGGLTPEEDYPLEEEQPPEGGYPEEPEEDAIPDGDDGDVVALTNETLPEQVKKSKFLLVEFYAPWCGHCKALAPEYKAAAAALKAHDVTLAKVDASKYEELAGQFGVESYPTLVWFDEGKTRKYTGGRITPEIITWVKKRIGFAVNTVATSEEAQAALDENSALVAAYFTNLKGGDAAVYAESGKEADDIQYYQTDKADVAQLFGLAGKAKSEVAVVKKEDEKLSLFDGDIVAEDITKFVMANRLPLIVPFSDDTAQLIFGGAIKKHVFLFWETDSNDKFAPMVVPVSKEFKGKIIFTYINGSNDQLESVREYFGIKADETKVVGFSVANREDGEKFAFSKDITTDNLKEFVTDLVEDKAKPFFKSEPIPEKNDEPVTVVVGDNFEAIVKDETKDVLLEIYAPWCGHCKSLEPVYKKLGKKLADVSTVVVAKMDGTANEHPEVKVEGFPTLLFYPANDKANPITVDAAHKLKPLLKFIKEHASIPFEEPKSPEEKEAETEKKEAEAEGTPSAAKDEL